MLDLKKGNQIQNPKKFLLIFVKNLWPSRLDAWSIMAGSPRAKFTRSYSDGFRILFPQGSRENANAKLSPKLPESSACEEYGTIEMLEVFESGSRGYWL